MKKAISILSVGAALLVGGLLQVGPALADQIVVCQACSSAPGGHPNIITSPSSFNMFVAGANKLDVAPTLIVIAQTSGVAPGVTVFGSPLSLSLVGTLGLGPANPTTLTAPNSNDVFGDAFHMTAGGSLNFGNLNGALTANGFATQSTFNLFAFTYNGAIGSFPSLTVGTTAANGSFIFGYACQTAPAAGADCHNGKVSQTVMTNSGLINGHQVPEPSSVLLLGLSFAGFGLWMWRKQRNVQG